MGLEFQCVGERRNDGCSQDYPTTSVVGPRELVCSHSAGDVESDRAVSHGYAHFLIGSSSGCSCFGTVHFEGFLQSIAKVVQEFFSGVAL